MVIFGLEELRCVLFTVVFFVCLSFLLYCCVFCFCLVGFFLLSFIWCVGVVGVWGVAVLICLGASALGWCGVCGVMVGVWCCGWEVLLCVLL